MQKSMGIGIVWLATLGAAWFIGREMAPTPEPETVIVREEVGTSASTGPKLRGEPGEATPVELPPARPRVLATQLPALELDLENVPDEFKLDPSKSIDELSREFMAWVAVQLGRGKVGHLRILDRINELSEDKEFRRIVRDEQGVQPVMYAWIRFLVDRDRQVVDMTETVLETMAEEPQRFEGYDDDTLEMFTEGVGFLLPSMVDQDRLAVFRTHAEKIIATPKEQQTKAVASNRREVERLLQWMQPPVTAEEAFRRFQAKEYTSPQEAQFLISRMTAEQLSQLDVVELLGPGLASGDHSAMRMLRQMKPTGRQLDQLDDRFMEGLAAGKVQYWLVYSYLQQTGRRQFKDAQGFLERALDSGEASVSAVAQSMIYYRDAPKEWVTWLLERHEVPENTAQQLRSRFKIQ